VITSFESMIANGTSINGKWNKAKYLIERPLGEGANGRVYLVRRDKTLFAMKIGFDVLDQQSEVNVLQKLAGTVSSFSDYLIDVDDFNLAGKDYPFYVMKFVRGQRLYEFMEAQGKEWLGVIGLKMLGKLVELHSQGLVFGDVKPENIMISDYGNVDLVDFGGVTAIGKSVRQFTEIFDRGYWNAGVRTADEAYDLFGFAILCMQVTGTKKDCFTKQILPQNRTLELLCEELDQDPDLQQYRSFLRKALLQQFSTSREAYTEWKKTIYNPHNSPKSREEHLAGWLKTGFAVSLILFFSAVYMYWD
jgi:serine/threonine protein kinase